MPSKLFLFLEGDDDIRFFDRILASLLAPKYSQIKTFKYSQEKLTVRERWVRSVRQIGADYIYVQDKDDAPCVTASKRKTIQTLNKAVDSDKIAVVIREIECWYLCGLDQNCCKKVGIRENIQTTESFTKEKFNRFIPRGMPRTEFMQRILDKYKLEVGKTKNKSFKYFLDKWTS